MAAKMSSNTAHADYDVGFGKPPVSTRFTKGQSGNPHGRPKGKKNLATMLNAALNETVMVNENGERKKITKLEATFKQVVNKAAGGDNGSTKLLIQMFPWLDKLLDEEGVKHINSEADQQIMLNMQKRLLAHADKVTLSTKAHQDLQGEH